ncbi:hypothetical protein [uncultured Anaerococcus sp.]|uniref:hypothetical protein n=1 Tax=uncultured Anaerococcus sp. TaxID=293428 RepID=UPI00288A8E66|nr:hypothetical protein [uncultured Anaerococcus sp.]
MSKVNLSVKQGLILIVLFIISQVLYKYFPQEIYLLKWTADRYYVLFILIIGLNYFEKFNLSKLLLNGHVLGLIIGEIGGRMVYFSNIRKITPDMSPEEVYSLSKNPAVLIYFLLIIVFLIYGIFREKNKRKL